MQFFVEKDEFLKRFYNIDEFYLKVSMLSEYYKYHRDIARLFMMPTSEILSKFHDK